MCHFIVLRELEFKLPGNVQIKAKSFLSRVTLKLDIWPWKIIRHLFYTTLRIIISQPSVNSNLIYSPEMPQFRSKSVIFLSCVTLKIDRWPWKTIGHLSYAISGFVHHFAAICEFKLELRSGNTQIEAIFLLTSVTLTFNLWPWPFRWTSLLSMVITHENFMMIRRQEHCEKGVTDRQIVIF